MTTKEILIAAKQKLEQGWTQKFYARDVDGEKTSAIGPEAVCWCAEGALAAVAGYTTDDARMALKRVLGRNGLGGPDVIVRWNDAPERTQPEVLAAFDQAIASL